MSLTGEMAAFKEAWKAEARAEVVAEVRVAVEEKVVETERGRICYCEDIDKILADVEGGK